MVKNCMMKRSCLPFMFCILIVFTGCELPLGPNEGRLDIFINELNLQELDWEPGTDIVISQYEVTLRAPDGSEITRQFPGDVSSFSFERLPAGNWKVDIRGYNSDGDLLAYLSRNSSGERMLGVQVFRAYEGSIRAEMISIQEGTGRLQVTADWSSLDLQDAQISLELEQLDGDVERSAVLGDQDTVTFDDLPGGVYQISVELNDDPAKPPLWEGVFYAYVHPGEDLTIGTIVITEYDEGTGDAEIIIGTPRNQADSAIDWSIFPVVDTEVTFTSQGTYESPQYRWYVNGQLQGTDENLAHTFTEAGNYHVVLSVLEQSGSSGFMLGSTSAVIRVFDDLPEVGDIGPGGGYIFYDKGEVSDHWRFLEAADMDLIYPNMRRFPWSNVTGRSVGTSSDIGAGAGNTEAILSQEGHESGAAQESSIFSNGTYDDWFLPSIDELQEMYDLLGDEFAEEAYWSSTEDGAGTAWAVNFRNGSRRSLSKDSTARIRTIRRF